MMLIRNHLLAHLCILLHPWISGRILSWSSSISTLPSFALKLNQQGFSPIHLAIKNGHSKLARRLVDMNSERKGGQHPSSSCK
ncbi:hypothetical protein HN51_034086 [Arachis hypogaea]